MATIGQVPADALERDRFLREHAEEIYRELTDVPRSEGKAVRVVNRT